MPLLNLLLFWPQRIAVHFDGAGALVARLIVGYTFLLTGWGKLQNLPGVTAYFADLGIPAPEVLTPIVVGWECFGGLLLMLGLLTRISAGGLAVIMVVATLSAQLADIHSLGDLFGLEEATYFIVFTWLAISGAGKASLDAWLEQKFAPAVA